MHGPRAWCHCALRRVGHVRWYTFFLVARPSGRCPCVSKVNRGPFARPRRFSQRRTQLESRRSAGTGGRCPQTRNGEPPSRRGKAG
eukprot:990362-Prymnesium_polylepis.1